jgi:diguanylate cyclase (GGDEF)-like protein
MKGILERLLESAKAFKVVVCFFLLGLVAAIDYATGVEISVSAFYPLPAVLMAWFAGRRAAVVMAVLAALTQLAVRIAGEPGLSIRPVFFWNALMELAVYAGLALALGTLRDAHARESLLARRDPLTGAANRRAFFERAELEFQRARRLGSAPLSVAYLDLDDFKAVNDRFGHEAGDAVLKLVVETIQDRIRSTDLLARLGGDEFAVLMVGADEAQAQVVLADLRQQLRERLSRLPGSVTLSVGAVSLRSDFGSFDEVMAEVDRLMYSAKELAKSALGADADGPPQR